MLQILQKQSNSWIFKGILVLIIISFGAFWGVTDMFQRMSRPEAVATIGRDEVSVMAFHNMILRATKEMTASTGQMPTADQLMSSGVPEMLLNNLVTQQMLSNLQKQLKVIVTQDFLTHLIQSQKAFRNARGEYDPNLARQILESQGMSEATLAEALISDAKQSQLYSALFLAPAVPADLADRLFKGIQEKRSLTVAEIPFESISVGTPTAVDLQKTYEQHAHLLQSPESRAFTVLVLDPERVKQHVSISEAELKHEYERRKAEFTTPERVDLIAIPTDTRGTAEALQDALMKTKNLKSHPGAKTYKQATKVALPGEFSDFAFKGQTIGVLPELTTKNGKVWVLYVARRFPEEQKSFESVQHVLRDSLQNAKSVQETHTLSQQVEDAAMGGESLEEIAKNLGGQLVVMPLVSAQGKFHDANAKAALALTPALLNIAFHTELGDISPLTDYEGGTQILVRIDQIQAPEVPPLAKAQDQVRKIWQVDQQNKKAHAVAEELVKSANRSKGSLKSLAQAKGLRTSSLDHIQRTKAPEALKRVPALGQLAFEAKLNQAVAAPGKFIYMVAQIDEIKEVDPRKDALLYARFKKEMGTMLSQDLMHQFMEDLKKDEKVEINHEQVEKVVRSIASE